MSKARKIGNLLLTIVLSIGIVLLGADTAGRVYHMLNDENELGRAEHSESGDIRTAENFIDNRTSLMELCGTLEEAVREDAVLHVNPMLQAPEEYDIWELLSDISQIGEVGLTDDEWLLYQKLCWYEECYETACTLPDYSSLLSDLTGILNKLPEVFYTWHFDSKNDVEAYEEALNQVPDLLERFVDSLKGQSQAGMVYSPNILEKQIQNCEYQLTGKSIFLEDFDIRIRSCGFLTEEEKETLIRDNRSFVEEYVWDSYKKAAALLYELQPAEECYGLGYYPKGEEYYAYLLKVTTGSDRTAVDMYAYLEEKRELVRGRLEELGQPDMSLEPDLLSLSAEDIISMLYDYTAAVYPGFPQIDYSVSLIPGKINSVLYQAFYLKDDRTGRNYIYKRKCTGRGMAVFISDTGS